MSAAIVIIASVLFALGGTGAAPIMRPPGGTPTACASQDTPPFEFAPRATSLYGVAYINRAGDAIIANADGTASRSIGHAEDGISWSADGRRGTLSSSGTVFSFDWSNGATTQRHAIGHGYDPVISPNGRYVAFVKNLTSLLVEATDGTGLHAVGSIDVGEVPTWSRDSRRIAWVTADGDVYVVGRDGHNKQVMPSDFGYGSSDPTFSPTTDRLAYIDGGDVVTVDPHGASRRVVAAPRRHAFAQHPSWSPDGKYLSFVWTYVGKPDGFVSDVCLAPATGAVTPWRLPVPQVLRGDRQLWSPDGQRLLVEVGNFGDDVITLNLTTQESTSIATDVRTADWVVSR